MTLHIINQHPQRSEAILQCLSVCQRDDKILLIGDALELLTEEAQAQRVLADVPSGKLFALQPDGTALDVRINLTKNIQLIDYNHFVRLATEHHPVVSW